MAITFRQHASVASASAASVVVSLGSALISGNTLIGTFELSVGASVSSVTDNLGNRWMQVGGSTGASTGAVELWYARGVQPGAASITAVMSASSVTAHVDVSEFNGIDYVNPLDQWSQNYGAGASINVNKLTPRVSGDLFVAVAAGTSTISAVPSGYTNLNGYSAYLINSGSTAQTPYFTGSGGSNSWVTVGACFMSGPTGLNPRLQFPEVLVEISSTTDYLAPLRGTGTWTNISTYVESMNLGPMGRQHELDRVQSSGANFRLDNRDGSFNTWNTQSYLYNAGAGLKPMNPIKVTSAWGGITYPKYFGYVQDYTPIISDVLNVDVDISACDLFQMLALKTLNGANYSAQVIADGGSSLKAYYELGDAINAHSVHDSSGNNNTGSLIADVGGDPLYGVTGPFLFDATTALDLTNKTNLSNGGFSTIDNQMQPPTAHNPINTSDWTFETWFKWTGPAPAASIAANGTNSSVAAVPNGVLMSATANGSFRFEIQVGYYVDGPASSNPVTYANTLMIVSGTHTVNGTFPAPAGTNMFDGNWHHVVVSQTPRSVVLSFVNVWIDGVWTFKESPPLIRNLTNVTIGSPPVGVTAYSPSGAAPVADAMPATLSNVALYSSFYDYTSTVPPDHYAIGTWFQSVEIGAASGDTTAGRLNKALAVLGVDPSTVLNVPYVFQTSLYAETNSLTTTSGLNYLQTINETEGGIIFQTPDGRISAYNREYQYLSSAANGSQALFSDAASVASTIYRYDGHLLKIASDDLDVWNDVQAQSSKSGAALQNWGPADSSVAATSASAYGPRTMQGLTGLQFEYDIDALALAQNYARWYNLPINRITQIGVNSYANGGANIPQMLGRSLMDRITVTYNGQTPGDPFTQQSLIEQITDTVDLSGPTWVTTWALSPYEILLSPIYLTVAGDPSALFTSAASVTVGQLTL